MSAALGFSLLGASLGAAGAISAQVVAALFTAQRESRNRQELKSQFERDDSFRRHGLLADTKRVLYAKLLVLADDRLRKLDSVRYLELEEVKAGLKQGRDKWWAKWIEQTTEIQLIAPGFGDKMEKVHHELSDWEEGIIFGDELDGHIQHASLRGQLDALRSAMVEDLALD